MSSNVVQNLTGGNFTTHGLETLSLMYVEMWGLRGNRSIKKAVTRAVGKGTTVIRRAYRDAAPSGPIKRGRWAKNHTKMRKAVFQRTRRATPRREGFAKVGFNVGRKRGDPKRAHHAHLPSTGTAPRYHKSGKYVGSVRPNNMIAVKVAQKYPAAIAAIEQEFINYINSLP